MEMFLLGMLVMWIILGGLLILNDAFDLNGGIEFFDYGWLCWALVGPWMIIYLITWIYKKIKKMLDKIKKI